MIIAMRGAAALSSFRINALLERAKQHRLRVPKAIRADYWYVLEVKSVLTAEERSKLATMLEATFVDSLDQWLDKAGWMAVFPRVGTVSPWASKATNILQEVGLSKVTRVERGIGYYLEGIEAEEISAYFPLLADRMTEELFLHSADIELLFSQPNPKPLLRMNILQQGVQALLELNQELGLALSEEEVNYIYQCYQSLNREPTDAELMMFAQANSEHCRHKIFNATFKLNGKAMPTSLFDLIRETHKANPKGTLVAYKDNASIIEGALVQRWYADGPSQIYQMHSELTHVLMKVETHNHPTAIAPFPGALTGAGGEIRDEGATGRGSKPKAGLCGFSVSQLLFPQPPKSWEYLTEERVDYGRPHRISSALEIMLEAPLGAAAFNNEFGRPNLLGYFRSFEANFRDRQWGYHKPIMVAGGLGNIQARQSFKGAIPAGALLIQLGGPGFLIGLGGGAASSMVSGTNQSELDFASVQRGNPELQRRCQEVIDQCWQLGEGNPIISIHDVGAGGLSNALPELVNDASRGGIVQLRSIPIEEGGMSPKEIWCNESQERYVLAISENHLVLFEDICARERCPFTVIGKATQEQTIQVNDSLFSNLPVDLPMDVLLGKPPKSQRIDSEIRINTQEWASLAEISVAEAVSRVLSCPSVASKDFLVTIGDRTVGGLTHRDQMVGPYQVPVADCAVTNMGFKTHIGEVMSMGERSPLALVNGPCSVRMAIGEALTNLMSAYVGCDLSAVKLSANWMAAAGEPGEDAVLYRAVEAASELCQQLSISIPVGKDSLSMKTVWEEAGESRKVISPLSLVVSAFAITENVRLTVTPELKKQEGSVLLLVELGGFKARMGMSALAQIYQYYLAPVPDFDAVETFKKIFPLVQSYIREGKILAFHDRSDGGLITTLAEMMFTSRLGLSIELETFLNRAVDNWPMLVSESEMLLRLLFNEELGFVIQVSEEVEKELQNSFEEMGLGSLLVRLGTVNTSDQLIIHLRGEERLNKGRVQLQELWADTSFCLQKLRDCPSSAVEERMALHTEEKKLYTNVSTAAFSFEAPTVQKGLKPRVAILREQGINGHAEMAFAFHQAGFDSCDVHMSDLLAGRVDLASFQVLAACGGFSYGDVLGAGRGWASTILFHEPLRDAFQQFFERSDTLSLGVCNGCQMLSQLSSLIPGTDAWPKFRKNTSEQYEARLVLVKVASSNSVFLKELTGAVLPVVVSHGEGRVEFNQAQLQHQGKKLPEELNLALSYVDGLGWVTERYPMNPNGSIEGIAGVSSQDGRVLILMPHPERVIRNVQLSWCPSNWEGEYSPWLQLFLGARRNY
ncbi:MAG: phosphoribosylformylglycinamidine synthase [Neisseriaceae bacterium]